MRTRVLQIVPSLRMAGAQNVAGMIARHLDPELFDVRVLSLWGKAGTYLEKDLEARNISVYYIDKAPGFSIRTFREISQLLADFEPHVVHTHLAGLRYGWLPCVIRNVPVRLHTVHNLAHHEVIRTVRIVHKLAFLTGFEPVSIADRVTESIEKAYGIRVRYVIPNGIELDSFSPDDRKRNLWREREKIDDHMFVFCCVARMEAQKNHGLLIRAFARAFDGSQRCILLLVGDETPLTEGYRDSVQKLGLKDRVLFCGPREDVPEVLNASDAFVLASNWEGNPLVVMEAMAAGLPIVATSVGGVPELVEHGVSGLLVQPENEPALADAMESLFHDRPRREAIAGNARKVATERFDVEIMARKYADLYSLLTNRDHPGSTAG